MKQIPCYVPCQLCARFTSLRLRFFRLQSSLVSFHTPLPFTPSLPFMYLLRPMKDTQDHHYLQPLSCPSLSCLCSTTHTIRLPSYGILCFFTSFEPFPYVVHRRSPCGRHPSIPPATVFSSLFPQLNIQPSAIVLYIIVSLTLYPTFTNVSFRTTTNLPALLPELGVHPAIPAAKFARIRRGSTASCLQVCGVFPHRKGWKGRVQEALHNVLCLTYVGFVSPIEWMWNGHDFEV